MPAPVRRAQLVGPLQDWRRALESAGVDIVTGGDADLVVGARHYAHAAVDAASARGAHAVLLLDADRRALRGSGFQPQTFVARLVGPSPRLIVPASSRRAVRHAFGAGHPDRSWAKRVAVSAYTAAARAGLPVPGAFTLGVREPGLPAVLGAARGAGLPEVSGWYVLTGEGDDLQRLAWVCFSGKDGHPSWVVKSSRVAGYRDSFDRDAAGLSLIGALSDTARRHAPRLLGRTEFDGMALSVETAAHGVPLHTLPDKPLAVVDAIATWIATIGEESRQPPAALADERRRLADVVVPAWTRAGVSRSVVDDLPPVPAVLQHNDLGCWNVLIDGDDFVAVDWESARPAGLPLWDLAYFLTDALSSAASPRSDDEKLAVMTAILRGEHDLSSRLFAPVGSAAQRLGVPRHAVGPIVTLGWLHHGLSAAARTSTAEAQGAVAAAPVGPLQRLAPVWLADPRLGLGWAAFTERG